MDCPNCSQPQASEQTQFCSACGFLFKNAHSKSLTTQVLTTLSPKQKGIRQGVVVVLLSLILIPAYILLAPLFPPNDRLVESAVSDTPFEKISQTILSMLFILGLVRMLYALLFQQGAEKRVDQNGVGIGQMQSSSNALPPAQSAPVSAFGSWRADSGELVPARTTGEIKASSDETNR
ncbi:MAG TPA: hypothetical protein VJT50_11020 [Pyrinomonadaceae bacterium]|nr:hypothetical protein [Pyrinomonadaceae bacterium]